MDGAYYLPHSHNSTDLVLHTGRDDGPRLGTSILGLPCKRQREKEKAVLSDVQLIQAGTLSSLFSVQPVRHQHGSSLSLGQQLYWILEQEILHSAAYLRARGYLLLLCADAASFLRNSEQGEFTLESSSWSCTTAVISALVHFYLMDFCRSLIYSMCC